jgi:hypothetical protein
MANARAAIFNTFSNHSDDGGGKMTKRNVNDTCGRCRSQPVIGLLFNQLSAYLFAFSGIRFDRIVNRIVLNGGINSNSSLNP